MTAGKGMRPEEFAALEKRGNLNIGATLVFPQDLYGMVIVQASKTGKVIYAYRLHTVDTTTGHQPARFDGPWPIWEHEYTEQEKKDMRYGDRFRLTWSEKKQAYSFGGSSVVVRSARYYRNFSY